MMEDFLNTEKKGLKENEQVYCIFLEYWQYTESEALEFFTNKLEEVSSSYRDIEIQKDDEQRKFALSAIFVPKK